MADKSQTASPSVGQLMKITLTVQVSSGEHLLKGLSIADPKAGFEYEFLCNSWFGEDDTQPHTLKWTNLKPIPAGTPAPAPAPPPEEPIQKTFSPHPPVAGSMASRGLKGESMASRRMYGEEEEEGSALSESEASTRRSEKRKSPARAPVAAPVPVPSPKEGRASPAPPAPEPAAAVTGREESQHSPTLTPSVSASLPPLSSTSASEASESGIYCTYVCQYINVHMCTIL